MKNFLREESQEFAATGVEAHGSRFIRACLRLPVDRTPVWLLRQAGRYMPEYMAVRKHHSLLDICRTPEIAAEVTITAAERLGVDAAIIFADLLLPFTPMGLDFEFLCGRRAGRSLANQDGGADPGSSGRIGWRSLAMSLVPLRRLVLTSLRPGLMVTSLASSDFAGLRLLLPAT